jgi:hypothetical protein
LHAPTFCRALLALAIALVAASPAAAAEAPCGTRALYGQTLTLYAMGTGVTCADVARITAGDCELNPQRTWGCFSFQGKDPALIWFRTREMFDDDWSGWIEARRPPCSAVHVTAEEWKRAVHDSSPAFPSEMQILGDDLLRCKLLRGMRYAQVIRLLGRPQESDRVRGKRTIYWEAGRERDSFFQLDSEYLTIRFDSKGRFYAASFEQG